MNTFSFYFGFACGMMALAFSSAGAWWALGKFLEWYTEPLPKLPDAFSRWAKEYKKEQENV